MATSGPTSGASPEATASINGGGGAEVVQSDMVPIISHVAPQSDFELASEIVPDTQNSVQPEREEPPSAEPVGALVDLRRS